MRVSEVDKTKKPTDIKHKSIRGSCPKEYDEFMTDSEVDNTQKFRQ